MAPPRRRLGKTVPAVTEDGDDWEKTAKGTGVFFPTMDMIPDTSGRTVAVAVLLGRTAISPCLHGLGARFVFIAKGNRKNLLKEIRGRLASQWPREADFAAQSLQREHGRIEKREIRIATEPVAGISFPWVGQVFLIKRTTRSCRCGRSGKPARIGEPKVEPVCGITSPAPETAGAEALPGFNRARWLCERGHRVLDAAAMRNEDRCRVRCGQGPE